MKIDYNWGNPPKQGWFKRLFAHKPAPNHMSNHYHKEHWPDADDPQGRLF